MDPNGRKTARFTRAHFEVVAGALRAARPPEGVSPYNVARRVAWLRCVAEVSATFARSNPRFDGERFYAACGAGE